jgi:spore coat polysaccharide biosynthesis protein SpsF
MKIVATIEARMESTRLPGKTVAPILGRPMLELLIERLRRAQRVDQIVVATTDHPADAVIEELAHKLGAGCFRGSSDDVLARVLKAAQAFGADILVEMTGDCPLLDPVVVDEAVAIFLAGGFDYVSNVVERTYPRGLDTQVYAVATLAEVDQLTQDPPDRENVSLYIYEHPERYRLGHLYAPAPLRRPDLRLTVDTQADLDLVRAIYERLYPADPAFSTAAVVRLLEREPELADINRHIRQKAVRP